MNALSELAGLLDPNLLLVYLRTQACLLTMPVFSEKFLAGRVKVALAMAMVPLLAAHPQSPPPAEALTIFWRALSEILLGFVLGTLVRILFVAINIAATAIAATASLSQIIGTGAEASPHPIGNFYHLAAMALILTMGFPLMVIDLLSASFELWSGGALPDAGQIAGLAVRMVSRSFSLALILATPFILGGVLFQAVSGVINRVMQALPVVFIGAPASIMLALLGLVLLTPAIMAVWSDAILGLSLSEVLR